MMRMTRVFVGVWAFCAAVFAAGSAEAKVYYWKGDINSDVTDLNLYRDNQYSMDVTAGNPAPSFDGLEVQTSTDNQEAYFRDSTMAVLQKMAAFRPRTGGKLYIDIDQDWTIPLRVNLWSNATIIKRGKGNLILTSDDQIDSQNRHSTHNQDWVVEGGRVTFPQDNIDGGRIYFYGNLAISNGCSIVLSGSGSVTKGAGGDYSYFYCTRFFGEGDILYTNAVSSCRFFQSAADRNPKPFSGRIIDPYTKIELRMNGVHLTNKANEHESNYIYGLLGARILGSEKAEYSSLGYGGSRTTLSIKEAIIRCLATAEDGPQTSTRRYWDYGNDGTFCFDAGAYGGLTLYDGHINIRFGNYMKELILTGSNTTESVFSMPVKHINNEAATCSGHYYLTKRGSGTWRMSTRRDYERDRIAGIGVEEGTLKFDSLKERGKTCSIGTATNLFGYAYIGSRATAPAQVPYAIRLGTATNLTRVGGFVYSGETWASCKTRPIAITGSARFGNDSDMPLYWKDVSTVLPPDGQPAPESNALTLCGSSASCSTIVGLTEGVGTGPLSLAKEGSGTWILDGDVDASGSVTVSGGTLGIRNYGYYTWFRYTITETVGGSTPSSAYQNLGARSMLSELGLFAADGSRLNPDLPLTSVHQYDSVTMGTLPPNYVANGVSIGDRSGESLVNLFDGSGSTTWWNTRSKGYITQTSPETWFPVVVHLKDGCGPAAGLDFAYGYSVNGAYVNAQPTHYTLEASADGENWVTLLDNPFKLTKSSVWHYAQAEVAPGDAAVSGTQPIGDVSIPAAERHTVFPYGISRLCVKGGATFVVYGSPLLVKNLTIDAAAGLGTLKNVTFETSGRLDVTGVDPSVGSVVLETDLTGTTGWENLRNWTFTIDGVDVSSRYSIVISDSRVRISKRGGVISYE